jgi:hypothetical protein
MPRAHDIHSLHNACMHRDGCRKTQAALVALAEQLAEVAALRKDAERYRWLRDRGAVGGMRGIFSLMPGEWDEAIDAAMPGTPAVG